MAKKPKSKSKVQPRYADLHIHSGSRHYNFFSDGIQRIPKDPNVIWGKVKNAPFSRFVQRTKMQSDFPKLAAGGMGIACISLYPFEKGFVMGKGGKSVFQPLLRLMPGYTKERVTFMQGKSYDYFLELLKEYSLHTAGDGHWHSNPSYSISEIKSIKVEGRYRIANGSEDVLDAEQETKCISVVLTIEGMHALGVGHKTNEKINVTQIQADVKEEELIQRIDFLKGKYRLSELPGFSEADEQKYLPHTDGKWNHLPFFITFAHHFSNALCGHARSLISISERALDQNLSLNQGFNSTGMRAVKHLLSIGEDGLDTGENRILVDIKHMCPHSRKEFYDLVQTYNKQEANTRKIPLIISHAGYANVETMSELIEYEDTYQKLKADLDSTSNPLVRRKLKAKLQTFVHEKDVRYGFNWWGINLSNEDLKVIHETDGLIGMCFDRRILGFHQGKHQAEHYAKKGEEVPGDLTYEAPLKINGNKSSIALYIRQIEGMCNYVFEHLDDPRSFWNRISIGSDFDGMILPTKFDSALHYELFEEQLIRGLKELCARKPNWFYDTTVKEVARKICYDNIRDFTLRYFNNISTGEQEKAVEGELLAEA